MHSLKFLLAALLLNAPACLAQDPIVAVIAGYSVTYPASKFGLVVVQGVPQHNVKVPPAKEYYLDYRIFFENDWQWVKGGKLPGLV